MYKFTINRLIRTYDKPFNVIGRELKTISFISITWTSIGSPLKSGWHSKIYYKKQLIVVHCFVVVSFTMMTTTSTTQTTFEKLFTLIHLKCFHESHENWFALDYNLDNFNENMAAGKKTSTGGEGPSRQQGGKNTSESI